MFLSKFGNAPLIDLVDASRSDVFPSARGRGYESRDYDAHPFGSVRHTVPFSGDKIPRSEWVDRVEQLEKTQSRLKDLHRLAKVPILDQKRTNYCWCFGVVGAMMTLAAKMGAPTLHLSAVGAAAKIKNFRNVGGWGGEAIEGINRYGVPTVQHWPEAAIDRRYDTPDAAANAHKHMVAEFVELPRRDFDAVATMLLLGFPVPVGLDWWGHLVYLTDLVVLGRNSFGAGGFNSWGPGYGENGYFVLTEEKATPAEAHAVQTVTLAYE